MVYRTSIMSSQKRESLTQYRFHDCWICTVVPVANILFSVATVRAALEVKRVFEQLAEAEKAGVTPEQRKKLEEQAAEKVRLLTTVITSRF
jgi:hypothetical protein